MLITGGAGFLGSNLAFALAERRTGRRAQRVSVRRWRQSEEPGRLFRRTGARRCPRDRPASCVRVRSFSIWRHRPVIWAAVNDPLADIAVNAVAQVRLIQAARRSAPDAVAAAPTVQFYGRVANCRSTKTNRLRRPMPNGVSKFAGEQYWLLEHMRGRPVVSLRLTNCMACGCAFVVARINVQGHLICSVLENSFARGLGSEQLRDLTTCRRCDGCVPEGSDHATMLRKDIQYRCSPLASLRTLADLVVRLAGPPAHCWRQFSGD